MSFGERTIASFYFTFTTLSTVGFGDYYPRNNIERLMGSFVLLGGVAIFSYIMGELLAMIK
jgi:voltage-gated potassium channel